METTINMNVDVFELLSEASQSFDMSKSAIIKLLMLQYSDLVSQSSDEDSVIQMFSSVKYQASRVDKKWKKFHIILSYAEYEFFLDLRKFLKSSVSRLVAHAIENFMKILLNGESNKNKTDNYRFTAYSLQHKSVGNVQAFVIYWGIPEKLQE